MGNTLEHNENRGKFLNLEPDQMLSAIERFSGRCTGRILALNSYENRVVLAETEDGSEVVAKFYRPGRWNLKTILEEHTFLEQLHELEIPVALPLKNSEGTVSEQDGILFSVFPKIRGRQFQELSDEDVTLLGRLMGRLHNCGASVAFKHRPTLAVETYGEANLQFLLQSPLMPETLKKNFEGTCEALFKLISPLFNEVTSLRIHGDCHLANLVWTNQGPCFLDFDDTCTGPAVQDLWMLIPSFDEDGDRQRRIFIKAYEEMRAFSSHELRLIEPLRSLRYLHYTTWIVRRWYDPIFPKTFPQVEHENYWGILLQDLREQMGRIDAQSERWC